MLKHLSRGRYCVRSLTVFSHLILKINFILLGMQRRIVQIIPQYQTVSKYQWPNDVKVYFLLTPNLLWCQVTFQGNSSLLWYLAVQAEGSTTTTLQLHVPEPGAPFLLCQGQIEKKLVHWFLRPQSGSYTHYFLFHSPIDWSQSHGPTSL